MQAVFETLFDAFYLTAVIVLGIQTLRRARGERQYVLFGIMATQQVLSPSVCAFSTMRSP